MAKGARVRMRQYSWGPESPQAESWVRRKEE